MGVIPPGPPPLYGSKEEQREQLIEYRDFLLRMQAKSQIFPGKYGRIEFPSQDFTTAMLILSPWILSVIVKLWIGDWDFYIPPPHW